MEPSVLIQQFFNALALGGIYALVALGYTMVYGIIELINFAHGDVFMVGAFVSFWILTVPLGQHGAIKDPIQLVGILLLVFAVTMIVMGVVGVIIERFAYRPLRNAPRLAPLLTAIGVSFILQNIIQTIFGPSPRPFPKLISSTGRFDLFGAIDLVPDGLHLPAGDRAAPRPPGLHRPHPARPRDAVDRPGPGCRAAHGRRHQPHHRAHVLHRLGAGGRRWRRGRPLLRAGAVHPGLLRRAEGVHRRRPRRDREHPGRRARWLPHRLRRGVRGTVRPRPLGEALVFAVLIIVLVFRPSGLLGQALGERA